MDGKMGRCDDGIVVGRGVAVGTGECDQGVCVFTDICDVLDVQYLTSRERDSGVMFDVPRSDRSSRWCCYCRGCLLAGSCCVVLAVLHVLRCTIGQEGGYRTQHTPRCASQGHRNGKTWQDETSFVLHLAFLGFLHQNNCRWYCSTGPETGQLSVSSSRRYCLSPETRSRLQSAALLQYSSHSTCNQYPPLPVPVPASQTPSSAHGQHRLRGSGRDRTAGS